MNSSKLYSTRGILVIIVLTSVINPFLGAAINIALPIISKELDLSAVQMSWVAMSFLLSSAVFLVPLGKLADIAGRKKIFIAGNILLTLSALFCGLSPTSDFLIFFRAIQGIGSAMVFGTAMAIITSAFPPNKRGMAIGINVTAVYLGLSIAPLLGGLITDIFGWRSLFFIVIPFEILVIVLTFIFIKTEWAEANTEKFDFEGSIIYVVAMSVLMFGFTKLPELYAVALLILGLAGLILFIQIEKRVKFPVLDINLFIHNRVFAFSNLAALINYAATFAIGFILSLYLQYIKGLTSTGAGLILVTQPIVMAIFASFSGKLSDSYPPYILSSLGMFITTIGLVLLSFINHETATSFLIICLSVVGVGFGLFSSPNTNSIMGTVTKKQLGVASATVSTMRLTGQMISMGIATFIFHLFLGGKAKITSTNHLQFLTSAHIIFILLTILCALGIFASLARNKRKI